MFFSHLHLPNIISATSVCIKISTTASNAPPIPSTFAVLKGFVKMDFKVSIQEGEGIVSGKIEGDLTKELAKKYFAQVGELAQKKGFTRVLTDVRSARLLANEVEMESLSKELSQLGLPPAYKRAIVLSEDVKGYKTWENYCFSNGHQRLKLFFDQNKAVDWLSDN